VCITTQYLSFLSSILYCRIRIQIPNSYDLNKKKPDIRVRYQNALPTTTRVLRTVGHRPFLSHKPINMPLRQTFSIGFAVHLSVGCFGWFWTVAGKQRVHNLLWRVYALLVQPPLFNSGFGKHNRSQRLSWLNEETA